MQDPVNKIRMMERVVDALMHCEDQSSVLSNLVEAIGADVLMRFRESERYGITEDISFLQQFTSSQEILKMSKQAATSDVDRAINAVSGAKLGSLQRAKSMPNIGTVASSDWRSQGSEPG